VGLLRPYAVAVRADDVAASQLGIQPLSGHQHRPTGGQPECLPAGVAMIEVHLMRGEEPAAIDAGPGPKVAQVCQRRGLSGSDADSLTLPVRRVVPSVAQSLVTSHECSLERSFDRRHQYPAPSQGRA
jgi:hypothetical protein